MTELSFLIDLLMNHKLQKVTKDLIAARIRDVESVYNVTKVHIPASTNIQLPPKLNQAPSTLAAMARHGDIPPQDLPLPPTPAAVEVIAQTPAAAQAMASRANAIAQSLSGKPEKGATSPRKW